MTQHQLSKGYPDEYTVYIAALQFKFDDATSTKDFYDDPAKKAGGGTPVGTWQLPLPVNVTENNTHEWEVSKGITEELAGAAGGVLDSVAGSTIAAASMKTAQSQGIVIDPNYRQIYNGSTPRTFQFEWNLVPSSEAEATTMLTALRHIKYCSLAGERSSDILITPPYSFVIKFGNDILDNLISIKECVITNVTINYTGQGYGNFYKGGTPKFIQFSVTFVERYTLDKEKYGESFKTSAGSSYASRGIK